MTIYHIIPKDDSREHLEDIDCHCIPSIEDLDEETTIVIHHSANEEEYIETSGRMKFTLFLN